MVTRNVPERFRGFLASVMCEVTIGVYTAPTMSKGVRERVWQVMVEWFPSVEGTDVAVVMIWADAKQPGGQAILTLGTPKVSLRAHDEMLLVRNELTAEARRSLTSTYEETAGIDDAAQRRSS